jgi:hypothetical protein
MKIFEIRRENLRELAAARTTTGLAKILGYRHPSFISQMIGPNPTREITEKSARSYERKLSLESGYLDRPPLGNASATSIGDALECFTNDQIKRINDMLAEVIQLVGSILQSEEITLSPSRFADLLTLAVGDAMEHNGAPRDSQIKQMVKLLKN